MTRRDRIALTVVVAVAALAAYWFLLLAPKRDEAAAVQGQLTQQQQRLQTAQSDLSASQAARASYAANYTAVAQLGKAVPADDDVPSLVYQLDSTAGSSSVNFQSIKLDSSGTPTPLPAPASPPAAGSSGSAASSGSSSAGGSATSGGAATSSGSTTAAGSSPTSSSSAPTTTAAAPTQAATASLPPGAVVGPAGLATMPFTFSFDGNFSHLSDFFGRLERFISADRRGVAATGRLLTINGVSLTFGSTGYPHLTASVSATAYLLPASEGLLNGASPGGPTQGGGQPVSSSGGTPSTAPATVTAP